MDSRTIIFVLNAIFFVSFFLFKNIFISLILSFITLVTLLFISNTKKDHPIHDITILRNLTFNNNQYVVTFASLIIFFVLEKFIGFNAALFIAFFIFSRLSGLDSRAGFFVTLTLLVITAFFAANGNIRVAEDNAILVYYFLVISVVWRIIELCREKPSEKNNPDEVEKSVAPDRFVPHHKLYNNFNFSINYKIILISVFTLSFISIVFFVLFKKPSVVKKEEITPITTPITAVIPSPFIHVPFTILNATDIRGFAGSSAATLRMVGWDKEFDFTVDNYDGTASANILQYTKTLEGKIKLLERDLKIQITPIIIKDATREAEMTLILGK